MAYSTFCKKYASHKYHRGDELDGTSGQDRESYSDDQDRDSYSA